MAGKRIVTLHSGTGSPAPPAFLKSGGAVIWLHIFHRRKFLFAMLDLVRAVAQLPNAANLLSSLVEQLPIAIFDTEMRYLAVSPHFLSGTARLTSAETFAPADVIGRSLYETFPKFPVRWREIN